MTHRNSVDTPKAVSLCLVVPSQVPPLTVQHLLFIFTAKVTTALGINSRTIFYLEKWMLCNNKKKTNKKNTSVTNPYILQTLAINIFILLYDV